MARQMWVLVEWVDENNSVTKYEIVNVDTECYEDSDLQPGNEILLSLKQHGPRRAKIIRISNDKWQLKEHKVYLERQDQQVKNVLRLCIRTIQEMKSDQFPNSMENSLQHTIMSAKPKANRSVVTATSENSSNDSDEETHENTGTKRKNQTRTSVRVQSENKNKKCTKRPAKTFKRQSIITSTPRPRKNVKQNIKLTFDQGTQTDNDSLYPSSAKIEEIELVLKHLYGRFQSLIMGVNGCSDGNLDISESGMNGYISCVVSNATNSLLPDNENIEMANAETNNANMGDNIGPEYQNIDSNVTVATDVDNNEVNKHLRVRRASAQTTYSNEMVPIGSGYATVPARLLNEINWSSYTNATRQLLQAIFPRKVLATHSLTGKQSPAHKNKPAKKLLDPNLVTDIITLVSTRSRVPRNLVRNVITVKCTDEAKLYRNRMQYRLERSEKLRQNDENVSPSFNKHSSDDTSNVVA